MVFEDVLKTIQNEQEAAAIRAAIAKNPETKRLLDTIEAHAKDGESYSQWYQKEWPNFKDAPILKTQLADAQTTITKLQDELKGKAPAGTPPPEDIDVADMTPEQFNAAVQKAVQDQIKAQGFVTAAEAQTMAQTAAIAAAADAKAKVYTHGLPLVERMVEVGRKFQADFGKPFDRKAFGEFLDKGGHSDVDKAYEEFTRQAYFDKAVAEAREQGKVEGVKETKDQMVKQGTENALRSLPVDMTGTAAMPSTPGAAPVPVELDKIPEDYSLGRKGGFQLAHAVAAQVAKDRAAGKQV